MDNEKFCAIAERFKEERERLGYSQSAFAELGDTKLRTLQNWEGGKNYPSSEFLAHTAKYGVNINYILTGQQDAQGSSNKRNMSGAVPAPVDSEDVVLVPLMSATGSMGAGNELVTEDVVLGDVPLSRRWLSQHLPNSRPSALRLMHAYGDSMRGTLESGDFALVDTDVQSVEVDGVYVLQAHSRLFIKRVRQRMDGCFEVSSDNPAIKQTDILNGKHEVRVCGRVVYGWNGRRF
jgi:phage repressor protein C with HTH and peptisase S24 domain